MSDEAIQKELIAHEKEMEAARRDIEAYTRKTLAPLWNKRREVVKKIPNFWGQAVRKYKDQSTIQDFNVA